MFLSIANLFYLCITQEYNEWKVHTMEINIHILNIKIHQYLAELPFWAWILDDMLWWWLVSLKNLLWLLDEIHQSHHSFKSGNRFSVKSLLSADDNETEQAANDIQEVYAFYNPADSNINRGWLQCCDCLPTHPSHTHNSLSSHFLIHNPIC